MSGPEQLRLIGGEDDEPAGRSDDAARPLPDDATADVGDDATDTGTTDAAPADGAAPDEVPASGAVADGGAAADLDEADAGSEQVADGGAAGGDEPSGEVSAVDGEDVDDESADESSSDTPSSDDASDKDASDEDLSAKDLSEKDPSGHDSGDEDADDAPVVAAEEREPQDEGHEAPGADGSVPEERAAAPEDEATQAGTPAADDTRSQEPAGEDEAVAAARSTTEPDTAGIPLRGGLGTQGDQPVARDDVLEKPEPVRPEPEPEPVRPEPVRPQPEPALLEPDKPEPDAAAVAASVPAAAPPPRIVEQRTKARHRLAAAMRPRINRSQLLAALLCAGLGFGLVVQVRSNSEQTFSRLREDELVIVLQNLNKQAGELDAKERLAQETLDKLRADAGNGKVAETEARDQLDTLGILAGTLKATGPGIELRIDDPRKEVSAPVLLDTLQELRDAGAEAVQIGTVRVVASTAFEDSEGGVVVGGVELRPPYVYTVIGDPQTLAQAMRIPGGVIDVLQQKGATGTITERQRVDITALHPVTAPQYARPAPKAAQ